MTVVAGEELARASSDAPARARAAGTSGMGFMLVALGSVEVAWLGVLVILVHELFR